jgi:hypothetical protein
VTQTPTPPIFDWFSKFLTLAVWRLSVLRVILRGWQPRSRCATAPHVTGRAAPRPFVSFSAAACQRGIRLCSGQHKFQGHTEGSDCGRCGPWQRYCGSGIYAQDMDVARRSNSCSCAQGDFGAAAGAAEAVEAEGSDYDDEGDDTEDWGRRVDSARRARWNAPLRHGLRLPA